MTDIRIDAHQHFWKLGNAWTDWPTPAEGLIYRDYGPADLEPLIGNAGIEKTILVQAAAAVEETHDLVGLAKVAPFVAGIVGWIDFEAPQKALGDLERLKKVSVFKGVRPMLQSIEDTKWILSEGFRPIFSKLENEGLSFDALVQPRHLPVVSMLADRYPDLNIIIDHCAKPDIAGNNLSDWGADMAKCAERANIVCKISGLLTEASPGAGLEDITPVFEHCLNVFQPGRLLWGSDWPVVNLNGDYAHWCNLTDQLMAPLSLDEQASIMGGTAMRTYRL